MTKKFYMLSAAESKQTNFTQHFGLIRSIKMINCLQILADGFIFKNDHETYLLRLVVNHVMLFSINKSS